MILLIDNYDSFSYNLVQLIGSLIDNETIQVVRNDEITVSEIQAMKPSHIILSPGPGKPNDAGICEEVIKKIGDKIPMLGVCLGHQAICEAFGGKITYAKQLMHGKQSIIDIDNKEEIFKGLDEKIPVARYHSLIADSDSIPESLEVIARDKIGEVMAVKHKTYKIYGLQFHPESVLTPEGAIIAKNFLNI